MAWGCRGACKGRAARRAGGAGRRRGGGRRPPPKTVRRTVCPAGRKPAVRQKCAGGGVPPREKGTQRFPAVRQKCAGAGPEGESLPPAGDCRGAGTGPQARRRPAPPPRAEPVGFGEAETACGPIRPLRKLLQKGPHPAMIKGRTINAYERGRIPCPKRKGF